MLDEAVVIMKTTVPGRAHADGQTGRANRVIKEMFVKMTHNSWKWDEEIKSGIASITQYNIQLCEASNYFTQVARDNMLDEQINQAILYNKTREDIMYQGGDWVLIEKEKLNTIKVNIDVQLKLLPRYCGPFKVVKRNNDLNYQIKISNR
ncbi:hypothetical protein ACTFIV_005178 [Dictyostelium citrinum]